VLTPTIQDKIIFRFPDDLSPDVFYVAIAAAYISITLIDMMTWALKKLRRQKKMEITSIDPSVDHGGNAGFACMPVCLAVSFEFMLYNGLQMVLLQLSILLRVLE
jgi:hypothetical protein